MLRRLTQWIGRLLTVSVLISGNVASAESPGAEDIEFFENEIRPLLARNCFECHGENEKPSGGVRLDSRPQAILRGGESGSVVTPGKPEESLLIEAVRYRRVEMPPKGKLPDDQIAKFVALGWRSDFRGRRAARKPSKFVATGHSRSRLLSGNFGLSSRLFLPRRRK